MDNVTGETPEVEVAEAPEAPEVFESESARYMRIRKAAKEEAAITMAAEAKAAQKAKAKRLGKGYTVEGQAEFLKEAAEVEARINAPFNTAPDTKKEV